MRKNRRFLAAVAALALVFSLAGCLWEDGRVTEGPDEPSSRPTDGPDVETGGAGKDPTPPESGSDDPTDEPTDEPTQPVPADGALRLGLGADAAALGAAGLADNDTYSLVFGVSDPAAAFSGGELDAALVPIDAAVRLYAATGGSVRLAAVTATGGWKIVERGSTVRNIWGLAGKTVYVPRESPMAVKLFTYVATEYDFILGDTLTLEEVPASELAEHDLALMPAELAGSTIVRDAGTHLALDLGKELESISGPLLLPVGCLVVRSDLEDDALRTLMADLKASQESLSENLDKAVSLGMAGSQEEAWAAANDCCALVWYTGSQMRERLESFIDLLYTLDPELIGGHIPDDGFYR